ncbi:MAG: hypothetical protein EOP49_39965, partial [Sphingobacteriales bacterium]
MVYADAIPLACGTTVSGFTTQATNDQPNPAVFGVSSDLSPNVWYSYTGTGATQVVTLSLCNSDYDTAILVATGTAGNLTYIAGNEDACGSDGLKSETSFTSDGTTTYWVMVRGYSDFSTGQYSMAVTCSAPCTPATANDECSTASTLTAGTPLASDNLCATPSTNGYPTCDSQFGTYYDAWYKVNSGTYTSLRFSLAYTAPTLLGYAVYSGSCGTLVQVDCSTTGANLDVTGLTLNTDYYIRVYAKTTGARGGFTLSAGPVPCSIATTYSNGTWSNGYPVASQPAIIASDFTSDMDLAACSLSVTGTAHVIISAGTDFNITGVVSVDATASVTVSNDANLVQDAAYVATTTNNVGNIKVKRDAKMWRQDYV